MRRVTLSQFLVSRQREKQLINADLRLLKVFRSVADCGGMAAAELAATPANANARMADAFER